MYFSSKKHDFFSKTQLSNYSLHANALERHVSISSPRAPVMDKIVEQTVLIKPCRTVGLEEGF